MRGRHTTHLVEELLDLLELLRRERPGVHTLDFSAEVGELGRVCGRREWERGDCDGHGATKNGTKSWLRVMEGGTKSGSERGVGEWNWRCPARCLNVISLQARDKLSLLISSTVVRPLPGISGLRSVGTQTERKLLLILCILPQKTCRPGSIRAQRPLQAT